MRKNRKKRKKAENKSEKNSSNNQSAEHMKEENKSPSITNVPTEEEMADEVKKLIDSLSHGEFDKTLEEITKAMENGEMPDFKDLNLDNFDGINEEMLEKIAEEFEKKPEMQNIMTDMMKNLVSKDWLYEPMKEISLKYPEWLGSNKGKISEAEYIRYCKHAECVNKICKVYEDEPSNTDKVVSLMQEMQELGQPPLDMIKSLAPGLEFSEDGLPNTNMLPELLQNSELAKSCCVM